MGALAAARDELSALAFNPAASGPSSTGPTVAPSASMAVSQSAAGAAGRSSLWLVGGMNGRPSMGRRDAHVWTSSRVSGAAKQQKSAHNAKT